MASLPVAVIWDLDGTLADSSKLCHRCTNEVLESNGYPAITEEQYHEGTIYPTPARFSVHVSGDRDHPSGEALGRAFDELYVTRVSSETAPLFEGIKELLEELHVRGVRLGVLSNACGEYVRTVLAAHELDKIFEVQFGADDVPAPKPRQGLVRCIECMGLAAAPEDEEQHRSDIVYIGDAPTDGAAANAANIRGVGVLWGAYAEAKVRSEFLVAAATVPELRSMIGPLGLASSPSPPPS